MTPRLRKLAYIVAAVAVLAVVAVLCQPATTGGADGQGNPGGVLARMRAEYRLRQSGLGKVDASSETMKLATLGLRPVAVAALWARADNFRKKEDWTNLQATLDVVLKLQPNFVEVWRTQSWNLAYNVSAECDDYKMRYAWVKAGLRLLEEGEQYNRYNTKLLWEQGFTTAQKIGRSDERAYFRKFYVDDDELHAHRPNRRDRDNFLVAKERYRAAESAHIDHGQRIQGQSPLVFWGSAPKCQIDYASVMQKETSAIDADQPQRLERFRENWRQAHREYVDGFGTIDIPTGDGTLIRLNDRERVVARLEEISERLDPGAAIEKAIRAEKLAALAPAVKSAYEKTADERTEDQRRLAMQADAALAVTFAELAERSKLSDRDEARRLADEAAVWKRKFDLINVYRTTVNFEYWRARCVAEVTDDALRARESLVRGDKAIQELDLRGAKQQYEAAFAAWRKVLDAHRDLNEDVEISGELSEAIRRYKERILDQLDEPFPTNFILQDIVNLRDPFQTMSRPDARSAEKKAPAAKS